MHMKKKIRLFLVALLVLSTFSASAFKDGSIAETPYIYPILPGDDVWNTLDTKQERLYLLQIPESVLDSLTTQELLELVLDYPYFSDYQFFDTPNGAYNTFMTDFNGFRALLGRNDITEVLLAAYNSAEILGTAEDISMCEEFLSAEEESLASEKKDSRDFRDFDAFAKAFTYAASIEFLIVCDQIHNGEHSLDQAIKLQEILAEKNEQREQSDLYSANSNLYQNYVMRSERDIAPFSGEYGMPSSVSCIIR